MDSQELDRYWETVVNTIRDGIMIVNTSGTIVSVNKAFKAITGYSHREVIGQPCMVLECDICEQALEKSREQWCSLFRYGNLSKRECIIHRKDGTPLHILKNASLLHDTDDNIIGAVEIITDITELIQKDHQIEAFRRELQSENGFHGIIGVSPQMSQVFDLIENAARSDAPVIIFGDSGTGKELVSKAIHEISERRNRPFIKVSCASLTESLLESELFGHVRGAFTGAFKNRIGRFEKASSGDIFLDEIGDLPLSTQVKLLRVLEEKMIERVGDNTPIPIDVRIISATNKNLPQLVEDGKFRKDFYFRINVIPINLPQLKNRTEDIPILAESFFRKMCLKSGKEISGISNDAMGILMNHSWPGNIRELRGAFEYAFVTCREGMIQPFHFPADIFNGHKPAKSARQAHFNFKEIEKQELIEALTKTGGNQSRAAEILGVSRVTVWNRMKRFGIQTQRRIHTKKSI